MNLNHATSAITASSTNAALGTSNYDVWASDIPRSERASELPMDIDKWTAAMPVTKNTTGSNKPGWLLNLEEWTHYDHATRKDAQRRNVQRLQRVTTTTAVNEVPITQQSPDVQHLHLHYSVCLDPLQRWALIELLESKPTWKSITMMGMHGMMDWYSRPVSVEELEPLFQAFQTVQCLNLYSCQWFRGHGLDVLCKFLPQYTQLQELRLCGWQWDRVAMDALKNSLNNGISTTNRIRLLSLQSCTFQGDGVVQDMIQCVSSQFPNLQTLNMSYCNLSDESVVLLVERFQEQSPQTTLQHLHLGGNACVHQSSVEVLAQWLSRENCSLVDLNLRALWVAYSEDHGLLERPVSLMPLYENLALNTSLERFSVAENILDNTDISQLIASLKLRSKERRTLTHLDVGDNPFSSEDGARALLAFVSSQPTLQSMRFENPYLTYHLGPLIHLRITFQSYRHRIQTTSSVPPLALWSNLLSFLGNHPHNGSTTAHDLIYTFLQSTSGEHGHILAYRVAQHALGLEPRQWVESGPHHIDMPITS